MRDNFGTEGYFLEHSLILSFFKIFLCMCGLLKKKNEVAQSCLTLCDPMDCSLPGSSIQGIFQARTLEWVAMSFSRGSSRPRDWNRVFCFVGRCLTVWAIREVHGPFLKSLLNLLLYCFCVCLFGHKAHGILTPQSRIEPAPPALIGMRSLNYWTTREVSRLVLKSAFHWLS